MDESRTRNEQKRAVHKRIILFIINFVLFNLAWMCWHDDKPFWNESLSLSNRSKVTVSREIMAAIVHTFKMNCE
jgi:hypothetical protein